MCGLGKWGLFLEGMLGWGGRGLFGDDEGFGWKEGRDGVGI